MNDNPIVEEVHRIREEMLAQYGGDLHALVKAIQRREEDAARSGRRTVAPPPDPSQAAPHLPVNESKKAG
jgi:hypothetical protein